MFHPPIPVNGGLARAYQLAQPASPDHAAAVEEIWAVWRSAVDFGQARSSVRYQRHIEAEEGHMAKYLILIYGQESAAPATPDQWDWMMQAHGRFAQAVDRQGGKILGGEALQPTATAASVRDDGQAVTDGPFVETKEPLGGFYLIEAADLDQALAFAKQCPAPGGGVELRPVMDTSGGPPTA
jgi:hypothetical protein